MTHNSMTQITQHAMGRTLGAGAASGVGIAGKKATSEKERLRQAYHGTPGQKEAPSSGLDAVGNFISDHIVDPIARIFEPAETLPPVTTVGPDPILEDWSTAFYTPPTAPGTSLPSSGESFLPPENFPNFTKSAASTPSSFSGSPFMPHEEKGPGLLWTPAFDGPKIDVESFPIFTNPTPPILWTTVFDGPKIDVESFPIFTNPTPPTLWTPPASDTGPSVFYSKTEPTLPKKTIVDESGVKIKHYTKSGDHAPAHVHVVGEGKEISIGQNGKPLKGHGELTPKQKEVVQKNLPSIRKAIKKIQKWHKYNNE